MRVLLTGAGGLLGSYVLRELGRGSADVLAWHGARDVDLADLDARSFFGRCSVAA